MEIERLLQRFAPMIMFDRHERYYPSTLEYYLSNCRILDSQGTEVVGLDGKDALLSGRYQTLLQDTRCQQGFRQASDLAKTPYYVRWRERPHTWVLTYMLFFPYTGYDSWYWCPGPWSPPYEDINLQTVELVVHKHTSKLKGLSINGTPQALTDAERFDQRVVLYSELHTHTLHTQPSWWWAQGPSLVPRFMEMLD
ncbi:MAG: hypothetical protein EBY17_30540 [Acidobacteriia bacterium]|nr:hypothetical protein [Terriglobia bacterium]